MRHFAHEEHHWVRAPDAHRQPHHTRVMRIRRQAPKLLDEADEGQHANDEERDVDTGFQRSDGTGRDADRVEKHHEECRPDVRAREQAEVEKEESNQAQNFDLEKINLSNDMDYLKKRD